MNPPPCSDAAAPFSKADTPSDRSTLHYRLPTEFMQVGRPIMCTVQDHSYRRGRC